MTIPKTPRRRATYEDVLQAPEHLVAEIVDGELHLSPRPAPRHLNAETRLASKLDSPFHFGTDGPGGWIILSEPELHLDEDIVVPDIAGWRRTRMATLPETAYFTVAPDWVCEVLSPSTARFDRTEKLPVYAREQISHVWLVDARARTLEVLVRDGQRWTSHGIHVDDARVRAVPFDAIEIPLADMWA